MTDASWTSGKFGDLILEEEFSHAGKLWCSSLLIPQEYLADLFQTPGRISPADAYGRAPDFWNKVSEATRDLYIRYLTAQNVNPVGAIRRQWFQWKDFDRLVEAFEAFTPHSNAPVRVSVIARAPAMAH